MLPAIRRTGAVLAWFLLGACRAYDPNLLTATTTHETASPSQACRAQRVELCNGEDDDCDGIIDEQASDTCSTQHARTRCVSGACQLVACEHGFVDCNGDADDGCERLITRDGCELPVVLADGGDVDVDASAP
jgi:hypothetical protein